MARIRAAAVHSGLARSLMLFVAGVLVTLCFDGTLLRSSSSLWRVASRPPDVPSVIPAGVTAAGTIDAGRPTAAHPLAQTPGAPLRGHIRLETVTVRARVSEPARPQPADLAPIAVNENAGADATLIAEAALAAVEAPLAPAEVPAAAPGDVPVEPPIAQSGGDLQPRPSRRTFGDLGPLHAPKAVTIAAPARTALPTAERRVSEAEAIRHALREYERAFESLDVAATARVWPSVNRRALARAFGSIRSQGLTFDRCEIEVDEASATAHCNGVIQFVPKVGSAAPARTEHEWLFRMQKTDSDWKIRNVTAYQPDSPAVLRAAGTQ